VVVCGGGVGDVPVVPVVLLLGGEGVVVLVLVCVLWPLGAASAPAEPASAPEAPEPASVTVIGIALSPLGVERVCEAAARLENSPPAPAALRPPPASNESNARMTRPRGPVPFSAMRRT
jgi:hypothetical protein